MKESIYNIYAQAEDTTLLFNSLYCGMCVVNDTYLSLVEKIKENKIEQFSKEEEELIETAKKAGFFVEDDFDELEYLRIQKYKKKFSTDELYITIAPTLACNFQCTYCYEDNKCGNMTRENCDRLLGYIKSKIKGLKKIEIVWYGGEPLLARKNIIYLSERLINLCDENGVTYKASMVTNGSLFGSNMDLLELARIKMVQITLDGPPEIHNSRRLCKDIKDNFSVIVQNINLLLEKDIEVVIRVNIDKNNISSIGEMLSVLSKRLYSKKVYFAFARVTACTDACSAVEKECFSSQEFSSKYFELYDLIKKYGFEKGTRMKYARPKLNFCGADIYNSFVVDAYGYIYKCWHDVGDKKRSVGDVSDIDAALNSNKCEKWLFSDATINESCKTCKVLPLCMGGCPSEVRKNNKLSCDESKYNITQLMISNFYNKRKER